MSKAVGCTVALLLALSTAMLAGCGGGSGSALPGSNDQPDLPEGNNPPGGGNPPVDDDDQPPFLHVDFPPPVVLVDEISTPTLTVRGRASDDAELMEVRIDGATVSSDDGFTSWAADVPLNSGLNTVTVTAVDAAGNESQANVTITSVPFLPMAPRAVALDATGSRLYVADSQRSAIFTVDVANGDISLLSGAGKGNGPAMSLPRDVAFDIEGERLIVLDSGADALLAVSLADGSRSMLSTAGLGEGPDFINPSGLALDENDNQRAYVTNFGTRSIYAVDLSTGSRRLLSRSDADLSDGDASVGTGDPFLVPHDLVHDVKHGRLLVADNSKLIAVDMLSGDRSVFTDVGLPLGMLALDAGGNRVLYGHKSFFGTLYEVDLDSGERTLLSGSGRGAGDNLLRVESVTVPDGADRAYVIDSTRNRVTAVDLATGDRTTLPRPGAGEGDPLAYLTNVAVDVADDRLLAVHATAINNTAIVAVDIRSGARTTLTQVGQPDVGEPIALVTDAGPDIANNTIWTLSARNNLYALDLSSGVPRMISGALTGNGPEFGEGAVELALDLTAQRGYVLNSIEDRLTGVSLVDGTREIVSDAERGDGPVFNIPRGLALSSDGGELYVGEALPPGGVGAAIHRVDAFTGNRNLLALLQHSPVSLAVSGNEVMVMTKYTLEAVATDTGITRVISGGEGLETIGRGLMGVDGLEAGEVDCHFAARVCYAVNSNPGGILAIDMLSGDRVFIAH